MKRFVFDSVKYQLYYIIRKSKYGSAYEVFILLKTPREIFIDNESKGKTNIVFKEIIDYDKNKKNLVKSIFKDNAIALLNMNNEDDGVIADLAQFKISYVNEIKPWSSK
jgi:hypothetical protein